MFEKGKITKLMSKYQKNKWNRNAMLVWNFFILELWYEQFLGEND